MHLNQSTQITALLTDSNLPFNRLTADVFQRNQGRAALEALTMRRQAGPPARPHRYKSVTMKLVSNLLPGLAAAVTVVANLGMIGPIYAEDSSSFALTLQGDVFSPTDLKVPAGKAFTLRVTNNEKAPVEIEAKDLKIEKVGAPGSEIVAHVKPLKPGRYLLVNEYREDAAKTFVVAE
jgi:Cupredoxin-like domain